jgi:Protein of unknown function (DUF1579)
MKRISLVFALLACAMFLLAQEKTDKASNPGHAHQAAKEASAAAAPQMPKPSPEMEKLSKLLVGTWRTTEKMEPMPEFGMPNGGSGTGSEVVKAGPGGFSVVVDYKSRGPMGAFAGHGVTFWDAKEQAYKSFWIDSMGAQGEITTGKWEGNDLVFTGESEMQGKKYKTLQKFTDITPTSFTFKLASAEEGSPMKEGMTITYKKVGGAAPAQTASKQ